MKINHYYYILTVITLALGVASCKKQVAVDPPVTLLATSNVFNSNSTATAAQLSIYSQLYSLPFDLHLIGGLSSDELTNYATDQSMIDTYTNSLVSNDASLSSYITPLWSNNYNFIYQLNAIIENLQISKGISPKVRQQLMGEAIFTRSYLYFTMVNSFGDIPLITTTNYKLNTGLSRTSKAQVYLQIIQDLTASQGSLSSKFVDVTDTTSTTERIRPTIWAADALLARVYLYLGQGYFDKAEAQATAVINNTSLFGLPTDLNTVFKKNSLEAIWQIPCYTNGTNIPAPTLDGQAFILNTPPSSSGGGFGSSAISTLLLNAFENNDQRKVKWIGTYASGTTIWNYPAKYKDGSTVSTTTEYTMVFRLAEQYLIRAEARAQQGNLTGANGAIADLNIIRNRAGLGNYSGATDQASVINAILHERQVELFAEGDRWFDMKRSGKVDAVMGVVTPQKGGASWQSYQQLYPILPADINLDPNIKQNPGY